VTTYLLDVNVLIALADPAHVQHDAAHEWFDRVGARSFATCPMTETGLLRILGNPRYPNSPGTPAAVVTLLAAIRALPGHHFRADAISPVDAMHFNSTRLLNHSQVTDSYLLALAHSYKGQLATMDRRLVVNAVHGGRRALALI
jgi:uncharacterized protein